MRYITFIVILFSIYDVVYSNEDTQQRGSTNIDQNCNNELTIIEDEELTTYAASPEYKKCEKLPVNFSNEDELKGPEGCMCVKEKNNPLDCDTFKNFLSLFRTNYQDIYKEEILTTAMKDLEMLALKHVPPEPMCDITEELYACSFPEGKLTLNEVIERHFEENSEINSIDDFKNLYKAKQHNKSILLMHDYEALLNTINYDSQFNKLKKWQKDYIIELINEREDELTRDISSISRLTSEIRSATNESYAISTIDESKILATQALMDMGNFGLRGRGISSELVEMNIDNNGGQEQENENGWSNYSWEELANYLEKPRISPRKKIEKFMKEREEFQIQKMIEKNKLLCKKTKEKVKTNCGVVREIDEGKISPPSLIALNKPESINILRDLAYDIIPSQNSPEKKQALQQEIDYLLEWFVCASNYQFSSEGGISDFVDLGSCNKADEKVIKQLISSDNKETYQSFHHGVLEDYYSYEGLSAEEIEQIESHSENVVSTFQEEGLINDQSNNSMATQISNTDIDEATETVGKTTSPTSSSDQDLQESSSVASYDPYTKSSMSSFNNTTTTASLENTDDEKATIQDDQQENDIVQNLLAELDKKREELAKLQSELDEAKKEKDQASTQQLSDEIAKTQQEIESLEEEVQSITDSDSSTQDTDIADSNVDDESNATRAPSSADSIASPSTTGTRSLSTGGGGTSSVATTSINPSSGISTSGQTAFDYSNVTEQYLETLPNTKKIDTDLSMMGMSVKNGYVSIGKSADGDDVLVIFSKDSEAQAKGNSPKEYTPLIELSLSVGSGISSILSGTPKEFRHAVLEVYKQYFNLKDEDLSDVLTKRKPAASGTSTGTGAGATRERSVRYEDFTKTSEDLKN